VTALAERGLKAAPLTKFLRDIVVIRILRRIGSHYGAIDCSLANE